MSDVAMDGMAEAIVRTIREPLLVLDGDLRVRAANPSFYHTFGMEAAGTLGRSLFELGDRQWDLPALRTLLEEVLPRDASVEGFELDLDFPGIGRRCLVVNARRLEREQDGSPPLILLAIQDVTERNVAREELERSNQELERFAYVASHDLQEPLRMVASYTGLLARRYGGQLDERADTYIRYATDGAERMKSLIQDLLTYSRAGTQGVAPIPTEPGLVLDTVLHDLAMKIEETGAKVTSDPLPSVLVDPDQFRQLLQNLVSNALKFSGDRPPEVHVWGVSEGAWIHLAVRDRGVGIDPQYFEQIFVIFRRLHGREKEGTGIGLALCKRIVERHGGRLWVESAPGEGSTLHFTLPANEAQ